MDRILTKKPVYKVEEKKEVEQVEDLDEYFNQKEEWKRKEVIDFLKKKQEQINIDVF